MGAPVDGRAVGLNKLCVADVLARREAQNASSRRVEGEHRTGVVDDNDAVGHTLNDCFEEIASHPYCGVRMAYLSP
jgi:hypothetical protein